VDAGGVRAHVPAGAYRRVADHDAPDAGPVPSRRADARSSPQLRNLSAGRAGGMALVHPAERAWPHRRRGAVRHRLGADIRRVRNVAAPGGELLAAGELRRHRHAGRTARPPRGRTSITARAGARLGAGRGDHRNTGALRCFGSRALADVRSRLGPDRAGQPAMNRLRNGPAWLAVRES
jgi:hypothetical protein